MTTPAEKALRAILDNLKEHSDDLPPIPAVCELWAQGSEALKKIKPVCPICGSADAVTLMTWVSWSVEDQDWEVNGTDDTGDCNLCGANDMTLEFIDADTPTAEIDLAEDQETVNRLAKAAWEAHEAGRKN
jgi:hypothetical protein